ncbi:3-oxoacyl-(acyl-carrier-protein) synthase [Synechococcus sp. PCC 7502]|uniref:beta-ketoacyl-ACP synthase n=1 Tax=Synechococcus sp. PCC 7502 TaxID=1173263 RepID=UPI00029FF082|nr:beta-ketoacyl-ACP synthase [Synechococcus sp. PCC 7502]AFY75112.1 3-oxoacyl-(acyl-carrier-protein) synthase [Synechococcus sp. PCC 7502]
MQVVVTGIGLVTSIGGDRQSTWKALLAGDSGIRYGNSNLPLAIVPWDNSDYFYNLPKVEGFLKKAVTEAIADANLKFPLSECGLVIGSSRGYQAQLEQWHSLNIAKNHTKNNKAPWLNLLSLSGAIAAYIQTQNLVLSPMAACATGNWTIFQAYELIKQGKCEVAIAGASDSALTPLTIAGFQKLGAMAKIGLYPFSVEREGMVLGEGAAVLVLESLTSAQARHVKIYGQILGCGISNDGYHLTNFDPAHPQGEIAINACLERSGLLAKDIDYISTHGTGTIINDGMEAKLIQKLFPHRPYISATKGATGHALGATGIMEAAFCLLALQNQILSSCIGMRSPAFDLNFVRSANTSSIKTALNLSFGFGGQNAVVAFKK